jgi:hypothetical protein
MTSHLKLCNAFALSMLPGFPSEGREWLVKVEALSLEQARATLADGFESLVGHSDTAKMLSSLLGLSVSCVRKDLTLKAGDSLIVAQYAGPRLPEGSSVLPPDAKVQWAKVSCLS